MVNSCDVIGIRTSYKLANGYETRPGGAGWIIYPQGDSQAVWEVVSLGDARRWANKN